MIADDFRCGIFSTSKPNEKKREVSEIIRKSLLD